MTGDLSEAERERQAREVYKIAQNRAVFWLLILFIVSSVALGAMVRVFGFLELKGQLLLFAVWLALFFLWDARVKGAICRMGLPTRSRSEVEITRRNPNAPPVQWREVSQPLDMAVHLAISIFFMISGLLLVNQIFSTGKHTFSWNSFSMAIGACGITFIPWYFLRYKSSTVRVDERGVFAYAFYFFPRLVVWEGIEQVYVRRVYHPLAGKEDLNILLKDSQGKTVLALGGIAFKSIARKKSNEIIAEIGRYFYNGA